MDSSKSERNRRSLALSSSSFSSSSVMSKATPITPSTAPSPSRSGSRCVRNTRSPHSTE